MSKILDSVCNISDSNKRLDEYILGSLRKNGIESAVNVEEHRDGFRVSLQSFPYAYADFYLDGETIQVDRSRNTDFVSPGVVRDYAKYAGISGNQAHKVVSDVLHWIYYATMKSGQEPSSLESIKVQDSVYDKVFSGLKKGDKVILTGGEAQKRLPETTYGKTGELLNFNEKFNTAEVKLDEGGTVIVWYSFLKKIGDSKFLRVKVPVNDSDDKPKKPKRVKKLKTREDLESWFETLSSKNQGVFEASVAGHTITVEIVSEWEIEDRRRVYYDFWAYVYVDDELVSDNFDTDEPSLPDADYIIDYLVDELDVNFGEPKEPRAPKESRARQSELHSALLKEISAKIEKDDPKSYAYETSEGFHVKYPLDSPKKYNLDEFENERKIIKFDRSYKLSDISGIDVWHWV